MLSNIDEAQYANNGVDGFGHLILRVEFAKKTT